MRNYNNQTINNSLIIEVHIHQMRITNSTKYYSILIGALFTIIGGVVNFLNYFIQYHYITNYYSNRYFLNVSTDAVIAAERTTILMLIILIISVILVIIVVKLAKYSAKNTNLSQRNGMAILIIGIIIFSFGIGDYIGPALIILGGFSFLVKEGDIVIQQSEPDVQK